MKDMTKKKIWLAILCVLLAIVLVVTGVLFVPKWIKLYKKIHKKNILQN